ncbi:carboxypeptidase-like regulatory domain-containing protein [Pseudomonas thivervalensis]|uniref:Carboxypeptidase regulatory-like domain-containing protein n=1 Tax=Pseudomonas thivervalensis TaxID=86265 RepID=A0A176NE78_9PSED|nr:carboxypeptidase-like regulatory domain-containing protein [Pseudomonas thivervalensis]AXA54302.1 carboxypeptidase regulatory-like domain-containing protein [Pseudomonas thivervalensis]AXA59982.1 carboxypeptidase regulatory-like domain-containing protein [Pseudomonas thivervalensis]OAB49440.1 hypothetical protein APS14_12885 [Pseudomonas thivervalensis]SDF73174.1 hypothetical protein SAMN04490204_1647 [Pseudomonas thivervalensis]
MRICFFDGADRIELGPRSSLADAPSMLGERSGASRIELREPWQADSFICRHFAGSDEIHRLRVLLSALESLVHLLDDHEVRRQVASKLWSGELCAYVYPYLRPMHVRAPASGAVEEVVAPVSAATRKRLPVVKASSESANRAEPVALTFVEIELLDMQGQPVAGESYVIALPNGTQHSGVLDELGRARVDGLDPGNCQVTFPKLDRHAVERWKGS